MGVLNDRVRVGGRIWTAMAQRPVRTAKARTRYAHQAAKRDLQVSEDRGHQRKPAKPYDPHLLRSLLTAQFRQLANERALVQLADLAGVDRTVGAHEHGDRQADGPIGASDREVGVEECGLMDAEGA